MRKIKFIEQKGQKGTALLYSVLLISALMLIAEIAFSYIVFSRRSRTIGYYSQVNYWLALGGIESALMKIHNYKPSGSADTAWQLWPDDSLIESEKFKQIVLDSSSSRSRYRAEGNIDQRNFINRVSLTYMSTKLPKSFKIKRDESLVFDVSDFRGELKVIFYAQGNTAEELSKNVIWFRAENKNDSSEFFEAIGEFKPQVGTQVSQGTQGTMIFHKRDSSTQSNQNQLNLPSNNISCNSNQNKYICSFSVSGFDTFRFLKIKVFQGQAELEFKRSQNSRLGLPESIIHSIGFYRGESKNIYVRFPNQLQSIPDVLDYSIYQADF